MNYKVHYLILAIAYFVLGAVLIIGMLIASGAVHP